MSSSSSRSGSDARWVNNESNRGEPRSRLPGGASGAQDALSHGTRDDPPHGTHGRPPRGKSRRRRIFLTAAAVIVGLIILVRLLLQFTAYPAWEAFLVRPFSPILTDRNREELRVIPLEEGLRRIYTPLDEYPEYLPEIFLAAEDRRFFRHPGVDLPAIIRAAVQNRRAGYVVSGASTVPMQLIGMAEGGQPTLTGKLKEAIGALRIETRHSKDELLELWLSSLPFGSNVEGVAAASRQFFGITPAKLSKEQALLLAVVPRRPELYDPMKNPDPAAEAAYALSLKAGVETSLSKIENAAERASTVEPLWPFQAPHFVTWVGSMLADEAYGVDAAGKKGLIERVSGGSLSSRPDTKNGKITTSLDLEVNGILQGAINSRVEEARRFRISNGAGMVMDARTGEILAYVGSTDFFDEANSGQVDGVQIRRQPGSTLKPFLYAMALESGYSAASILPDIPMSFGNEEIYIPQNFNQRYNGPVRLRTALSSSLNIPAVYLAEKIGVENFTDTLARLGFDSLESQRGQLGVGLAVGNAEVRLFELVRAYTVFAGDGRTVEATWRTAAERPVTEEGPADSARHMAGPAHGHGSGQGSGEVQGGSFQQGAADNRRIFERSTVQLIQSILSDNVDRILAFGRGGLGTRGFDAIMKTGTSNQFNNIWAVGVTPEFVCGIWMGNFSGETVIGSPGSGIPADALVDVMTQLQNGERFPSADTLREVEICSLSGGAATDLCPSTMTELFRDGEGPPPCSFHIQHGDGVQVVYPVEYRNWAELYGINFTAQESQRGLRIVSPPDGAVFFYDSSLPKSAQAVPIDIEGKGRVRLSVNGELVSEGTLPLRWFLPMERGYYHIHAASASDFAAISVEMR